MNEIKRSGLIQLYHFFVYFFLKVNSLYSLKFLVTPFLFEWMSIVLIRIKSLSKALVEVMTSV